MRVAVYRNNRDIRIEERPTPRPGPGELLIRVEASGICGSDAMEWYRVPKAPVVLGHEVAGVVEQIGEGVEAFSPGDRVVTTHHVPCGECRYCATDRESFCETLRLTSFDPGGFAELVRLPEINVRKGTFLLPPGVSFEAASFVEPLACVVRAHRWLRLARGASIAVLGSGLSGLLHLQFAARHGAGALIATDLSDTRRAAALRFGAHAALDPQDDVEAAIRSANDGRLAEAVIVCAGARAAFEQALRWVDRGGVVLFFAPLPPGETIPLHSTDLWTRGVTLTHSYAGPPADMQRALELIASGSIDVESMITHRLPLAQTVEGFRLLQQAGDALKVIIEPQR